MYRYRERGSRHDDNGGDGNNEEAGGDDNGSDGEGDAADDDADGDGGEDVDADGDDDGGDNEARRRLMQPLLLVHDQKTIQLQEQDETPIRFRRQCHRSSY